MSAKIISGTEVAKQIREELKAEVDKLEKTQGLEPGLVTILVGENPASVSYVTAKQKTAHELGFYSLQDNQSEDMSEDDLLQLIAKYNGDSKIHGILVQLPLPKHIDENKVLYAIDPKKDVDGFHPVNIGRNHQRHNEQWPGFLSNAIVDEVKIWNVALTSDELIADSRQLTATKLYVFRVSV